MAAPPSRQAPLPPSEDVSSSASGIEDAVAALKAALERDPEGFSTDATAKAILDKLNTEIAKIYGEEDDASSNDDEVHSEGEYEDDEDEQSEGEDGEEDAEGADAGGDDATEDGNASRVELPKGPRPYDLWRAAHEVDRPVKPKVALSSNEWNSLVHRLNESSRLRQGVLLRAQHQQIAAELAGLSFRPHISEKSRELAAANKSLPQRVEALMRKKKAKLDKIRHDRVEAELRDATFKPNLAKTQHARAARSVVEKRRLGHLMQYDADKRLRASERKRLIEIMESRDLTFNPAINRNSARIVERLNRERAAQQQAGDEEEGGAATRGADEPAVPSSRVAAAKKALSAALAAGLSLSSAVQVTGLTVPDRAVLKSLGRSYLPGHEEETFQPRINPRSAALQRPAADGDRDVYSRLYDTVTAARAPKLRDPHNPSSPPRRAAGDDLAASGGGDAAARVDAAGEPLPGHPHYFNVIPFDAAGSGSMDFILRRLLPPAALATAAAAALASSGGTATSHTAAP